MATLLILRGLTGELRGVEFPIQEPAQAIIGRSRRCPIRIATDATVSRQHCLIELDEYGAWAQDLGSMNGTFVNGERIGARVHTGTDDDPTLVQPPRHALQDGDELRICNNLFAVCLTEVTTTAEPITSSLGDWELAIVV